MLINVCIIAHRTRHLLFIGHHGRHFNNTKLFGDLPPNYQYSSRRDPAVDSVRMTAINRWRNSRRRSRCQKI